MKSFKRLIAAFLLIYLIVGNLSVSSVEAALQKPTGLTFDGWYNEKYTGVYLKWNAVKGVDEYQIKFSYTDNSSTMYRYTEYTSCYSTGLKSNRIYRVSVRALKYNEKGKIIAKSPWSASIYTIPLPTRVKFSALGKNEKYGAKLSWNQIYGSQGYQFYMTTNPSGKWYLVNTSKKANSTTIKVKKFRGHSFKCNKNYYYRILPRLSIGNGKYKTAPLPTKNYYEGYFWWY